ncbi:MAG: HAD-IIIA family hydrolase [Pseudohongiellaceae bacterium]
MKFNSPTQEITRLAAGLSLLVLDVDGVLTDGKLYYGSTGEEIKAFHILDGHGIKLLQAAGVRVAIITGRKSEPVARRAAEMGVELVFQGREDKLAALQELLQSLQIDASATAYVGDDLLDLPALRAAGIGITVPNGHKQVREAADLETDTEGGSGAVREVCDFLLETRQA